MYPSRRNAFTALCNLASNESWCWKITCTTCGHMYFRYGFQELILGKHPDSSDWLSGKNHHDDLQINMGPMPTLGSWPLAKQRSLASILTDASPKEISSIARFPDWLGYLGLGLLYTEAAETGQRLITKRWVPDLIEMLEPNCNSRIQLEHIIHDTSKILTWEFLELCERDLGAKAC